MQFRLVLMGMVILLIGLVAYSAIPNIHRTPLLISQNVIGPENLTVSSPGSAGRLGNVTLLQGRPGELWASITVTLETGGLSSLLFQVFAKNATLACSNTNPGPNAFLLNQRVSNESLSVPVKTSGGYCFVFNNENSPDQKNVSISVVVRTASEEVYATRDGSANMAGLGVGAFGFLVFLYGVSRKNMIPWE